MELAKEVLERVGTWDSLSRWEKSELGKELRRLGLSYGEIMELVPVKKSTLATWCQEIALTDDQIAAIKERRAPQPGIPRDTNWRRRLEIEQPRQIAREQVPSLMDEALWVAGVVLYWAEGAKTRNQLNLANSDPRALRLFVRWIQTYVNPSAEFSLQLHLHQGNDESAARSYWRNQTGLERATFHKTYIKPSGTGHRKNHLKQGVCTVKVRRPADAWNVTMEWIEALGSHFSLPKDDH